MDYFYITPENIRKDHAEIADEEFSHLVHVMRKKVGDAICIVDGLGTAYDAVIASIEKRIAIAHITMHHPNYNEPEQQVTLAVGILKNSSKFDFLVEKATELGAHAIIPLTTERTISRHAKSSRWQKLALAAMKQCGRSFLPKISELQSLEHVLKSAHQYTERFVCHVEAPTALASMDLGRSDGIVSKPSKGSSVLTIIGPEGGLSESEIAACIGADCIPASLGRRRLRTETAAICATALLIQP